MEDQQIIIIKKVKKRHNEGHHGGSWKVAYADFVTAMMAFFLLLWLLSMVSPEKRIAVAEYFKSFSVMKESGSSFMTGSSMILDKAGGGANSVQDYKNKKSRISPKDLQQRLTSAIDLNLQAIKDQVIINIVDGGLKIQIVDKEGSLMFPLGSAEPTAKAKEILKIVSENIKDSSNRIIVEGHTDAAPFQSAQTTNWELSTSRASAARRELEKNSIDPGRIAKVIGYADQELLIPLNPMDPRNRRISIIVVQPK
ncbi:chemotaxis protein MotB [Syntrophus gentianae]|uniref:Chemotaxis protein MotB n=1 Tax=Syntrophus gentianae TaxID=43775 RepID=A0A1H7WY04_9BACT|nr:flagellar motor protein MotB [Syntrophus gentianae]SEM26496.1 chemotaxis protein MotB [Syntrophus gentianae]